MIFRAAPSNGQQLKVCLIYQYTLTKIVADISSRKGSFCPECQIERNCSRPITPVSPQSATFYSQNGLPPVQKHIVKAFSIDKLRPLCPVCNPGLFFLFLISLADKGHYIKFNLANTQCAHSFDNPNQKFHGILNFIIQLCKRQLQISWKRSAIGLPKFTIVNITGKCHQHASFSIGNLFF